MGLARYKAKRDFTRTPEPPSGGAVRRPRKSAPRKRTSASDPALPSDLQLRFVVQKHDATRLHYDFRLEMDGVLKSWAVPKGFPTRRGERHLAVEVEDHPLEYAGFEGTIPEGNYGAGTVMVWDRGQYDVLGEDPLPALRAGKLHLRLAGGKLKGEWTLVRMKGVEGDKPQWLLLKSGEDAEPFSAEAEHTSILSGRTLEEISSAQGGAQWASNRPAAGSASAPARAGRQRKQSVQAAKASFEIPLDHLPQEKPHFLEPMKALLSSKAPEGEDWMYEVKFDGIRALAVKTGSSVTLYSRAGNDLTGRFPEVAEAIRRLPVGAVVLDGEVAALDDQGRTSFQLLQSIQNSARKPTLSYYVFDALNLEGRNVRQLTLDERKAAVQSLLKEAKPPVRFSPGLPAMRDRVMAEMQARGLEGVIAKKRDSQYEPGSRSGSWLKVKWSQEQEFVIGGYTEPRGARTHFGALLVGYYDQNRLLFAAKVGTGFGQRSLVELHRQFHSLIRKQCPFANLPEKATGRFGGGLSASEMRRCTWLEPKLVCQVRFAEWTRDHHLRQPAFLGLREDKRPEEVVREA